MLCNKIKKNQKNHFKNNLMVIGIDLGTTYSVISYQLNNDIKIIDEKKKYLIPSIVYYGKEKTFIGEKAKKMIIVDPLNTIISIKRLIGHSIKYIQKKYPDLPYNLTYDYHKNDIIIHTQYKKVTPTDVYSEILNYLLNKTIKKLKRKIYGAVITVPAYFNDIQRQKTKKSAELSGIKVLRLLNEPTSAAIAYGLNYKKNKTILIYDLGGGTFDISLLTLSNGVFDVIAVNGDFSLGGDDFDHILSKYLSSKYDFLFTEKHSSYKYFLKCANKIKIILTSNNYANIKIYNKNIIITREKFNFLIKPLVKKTILLCKKTIETAKIKIHEINEIILVGGSTLIPYIQENIKNFFKKQPLCYINPKKVVAIGAGIYANNLIGNQFNNSFILLDVLPFSLGIEVMGGLVEKILFRNTTIPVSKKKVFTTFKNNQTKIMIHILQGEKEKVQECQSLYKFHFNNLPLKPAGKVYIFITFEIDINGILHVITEENTKNLKINIKIDYKKHLLI